MRTSPFSTTSTRSKKKKRKSPPSFKSTSKYVKALWIMVLFFILLIPSYIYSVQIDLFGWFGGMPDLIEIENPKNDLSSEILSADGVSLGRYFRYNRSQIAFNDLSTDLVQTLLISEDHRFYQHPGLDMEAIFRAIFGVLTFRWAGGGSTITQQLAKNLYTQNPTKELSGTLSQFGRYPRRLIEKTKEWIISVNLERNFTKSEIIAMYLNTVEFSSNTYGIRVASETYFNKEPNQLNVLESAMLVGMLQNPSRYNPIRWPERTLRKRNEVLHKLYLKQYKVHTKIQYDTLCRQPLGLNFTIQDQNRGLATYFRTVLRNYLIPYCRKKGIDLWNSGLRIHTTIDSRMQKYAEEALRSHMKPLQNQFYEEWEQLERDPWSDEKGEVIPNFLKLRIRQTRAYQRYRAQYGENSDSINIRLNQKRPMRVFTWEGERDTLFSDMDSLAYYKRFLHAGMIVINPFTGHVKAWVGGINHKYFKFDHVKQGARQPGSTFKPFVYGLAMESGYSPCQELKDVTPQFIIPDQPPWYPLNSDGTRGTGQLMTLRQAMARSVNSITAQMIQALGPKNVVEFAHRVGIESHLDAVPSLCLGVCDVSLYEMASAYGTFVNGGIYIKPIYITSIEDKDGNTIENFVPKTRHAIDEQTAYKMIHMLRGGVDEIGGTSRGLSMELRHGNNELGGKTGTTNDASDGWYIGVTNNLVAGVWVGGDERAIRFSSWLSGQGSRTARPIWEKFMLSVYANPELGVVKGPFQRPASGVDVDMDCNQTQETIDSLTLPQEKKSWKINQ